MNAVMLSEDLIFGRENIAYAVLALYSDAVNEKPVVVSPAALGVSCPVVCEDPPHSGPVAGVATGVAWIAHTHPTISLVTVLAVDAPDSPLLIPQLADALRQAGPQADAVAVLADGYVQPLGVLWRLAALQAALERVGDFSKAPLKRLLRGANIVTITPTGGVERDYDTPEELQNLPPAVPLAPPRLVRRGGGVVAHEGGVGHRHRHVRGQDQVPAVGAARLDHDQAVDALVGQMRHGGAHVPGGRALHLDYRDRVSGPPGRREHALGGQGLAGALDVLGDDPDGAEGSPPQRRILIRVLCGRRQTIIFSVYSLLPLQ